MATLYNEEDLKKIVLKCKGEGPYLDPTDMINSDGTKNYAYVTLVMLGDLYVSAAIVLAYSLRKLNTKADLVVLVTPDVSESGKKVLGMFFDKIKEINYVTVPNWRTKKQSHRKYLELVFTKFHLFELTEYKKVLLIDADALVLKYPNHLFSLKAPAGCFLENKDYYISYDKDGNYILPPNGKIKWYEMFCECCPHGSLIPKYMTDRLYKDYKNSGIGGGLQLLEPKKGEFASIIKDVSHGKMKYLLENKLIWPEQQYLTLRYSGLWHMVNPVFFGLQGYPHYSILYGLQYGGDKPFVLNSKIDIDLRIEFPDFILWHKYYGEILKEHPEFKNNIALKETNEMHKFFKIKLNRYQHFSTNEQNKLINIIANKYKVSKNVINPEHIEYYSLDEELNYRPVNYTTPLFSNVNEFDYMEPIKKLTEYYKNFNKNYYKNLLDLYQLPILKDNLQNYDIIDPIDKDEIMLQYIKCRPNTFVITVWSIGMIKFNELEKFLKTKGNIYYTKIINLSKNAVRNLMFWMYDEFRISSKLEFIEKKLDYTNTQNYDNKVGFIIFDNINNYNLSGQGSIFKKEIRNKIVELLDVNKENIRGNDVVHINDYFYQTVEYSQIILNKNSLKVLEHQDVRKYNNYLMKTTNLKIQTLRKWMYNNLSLLEIMRMLIISSLVLFAYTIRKSNDIDGFMLNRGNSIIEKEFEELIYINLNNDKTRIYFMDFGLINSSHWKQKWTDINNDLFNRLNISTPEEITFDPRYHLYFNGLKIYNLEFEIVRKIRHKIQDYSDFIMMYFYHRNLLGHYVYLNKDNKLEFEKSLNVQIEKKNDYLINKIKNEIDKKYPKKESEPITKKVIEEMFY